MRSDTKYLLVCSVSRLVLTAQDASIVFWSDCPWTVLVMMQRCCNLCLAALPGTLHAGPMSATQWQQHCPSGSNVCISLGFRLHNALQKLMYTEV